MMFLFWKMITSLFLLLFLTVPSSLCLQLSGRRNKGKQPPCPQLPGMQYSRIVGIFPSFRNDAATTLIKHAEYCWENEIPAIRLSLGVAGSLTFVVDPPMVDFIMSDRAVPGYPEGIFYKSNLDRRGVGLLTSTGVLLSDGPDHTRKRRLIVPSFDSKSLEGFVETMETVSKEFSTINNTTTAVNIPEYTSALAMKIVGLCLFSSNVLDDFIYQDICKCLDHVVYVTRHPFAMPQWVPTRRNRQFKKALKSLDDLMFSLMEKGRQALSKSANNNNNNNNNKKDLLGMLLSARYEDEANAKLTDKELRDELITLFLAGHETSANTLSWALWYLSDPANAKWQEKIVQEYDALQSSGGGFSPRTLQDVESLKYTRAVLCETLRLRTPSYAVDRETQQDVTLPGSNQMEIFAKRKSLLLISPLAMHMNPKYFPNPYAFDPSRFLDCTGKDPWDGPFDRSVYLPFGAGRKRCIGFKFAQWEMLVFLSTLVKHVSISRTKSDQEQDEIDWLPGITLRPPADLQLNLTPRETKLSNS